MITYPKPRRTVRCWKCGHKARRVANTVGMNPYRHIRGRVEVVHRNRRPLVFGLCPGEGPWGYQCGEPMLLPRDAKYVLRAALGYERGGGNRRSEFDA